MVLEHVLRWFTSPSLLFIYTEVRCGRWSCECRGAAPGDTYALHRRRGGASTEHLAATLVKVAWGVIGSPLPAAWLALAIQTRAGQAREVQRQIVWFTFPRPRPARAIDWLYA